MAHKTYLVPGKAGMVIHAHPGALTRVRDFGMQPLILHMMKCTITPTIPGYLIPGTWCQVFRTRYVFRDVLAVVPDADLPIRTITRTRTNPNPNPNAMR